MKSVIIFISTLITVCSCVSSNRNKILLQGLTSKMEFLSPSYSFYHVDGDNKVIGRILERGLRDTFNHVFQKNLASYFPRAKLSLQNNKSCLDFAIHRGNWREIKWKDYSTYKCLKIIPDNLVIHLLVRFEDYDGSTVGLSNPPSNSWIGVHIIGFKDNTVLFNKYVYDAITISNRQQKMMLLSNNYNPYFPKEQIVRVMERVFVYLQKELM